jgi:dihydroorotate dehydrogenase
MYRLLRPLLFALPPDEAHALGMAALGVLEEVEPLRRAVARRLAPPASGAVTRMGLTFPSRVGLAGGFDKDARAPRALAALGFGFLELGTVTAEAQEANPRPNLFRLPDDRALVNRLGFPNDGAATVAARFAREVGRGGAGVPVGFSIGKSRSVPLEPLEPVVADYLGSFRAVREVADFIVVNISSPNTKGLRALQGPELARALLSALAAENERGNRLPLLLKISPDMDDGDLEALLSVVREVGLDGVVATNTSVKRDGLATPKLRIDEIGAGGLSGPPLRPRVTALLPVVRRAIGPDATLIAVGGISSSEDARAYLDSGADLVQLYTGFIYEGPGLPSRLARDLTRA